MFHRASAALVVALGAGCGLFAFSLPQSADAATTWLCRPGIRSNPCLPSQSRTTLTTSGGRTIATPAVPARPRIDCFFAYPTVSDQQTPQASLAIDDALRAVARDQAGPYSQACSIYAPVYRQITLRGSTTPSLVTPTMTATAYADVLAGWREYLAKYNKGRGVLVFGHSQGAAILRRLLASEVDGSSTLRRKLVAAHLSGGDVLVRKGADSGGDFANIPACRKATQLRCVVAWSSFNSTPPGDARFGKAAAPAWKPTMQVSDKEVLCTNPANLARGGSGNLTAGFTTLPYPGTVGILSSLSGRPRPTGITTPWVFLPDLYSSACVTSGNLTYLRISDRTATPAIKPVPDASWGLHLVDTNIAMGNMISIARSQASAW